MRTGINGLNLLKSSESCRLKAYADATGTWTIGWGHTGGVNPGDVITQAQADAYLVDDLLKVERVLNANNLDLNQNQFDAMVDLLYNAGTGVIKNFIPLIQNENWDGATALISKYHFSKGVSLPGLVTRRAKDVVLFKKKLK